MQITSNAADKVAGMKSATENLRVYISGGGCSGFSYGFKLDETSIDGDYSIDHGKHATAEQNKKYAKNLVGYL